MRTLVRGGRQFNVVQRTTPSMPPRQMPTMCRDSCQSCHCANSRRIRRRRRATSAAESKNCTRVLRATKQIFQKSKAQYAVNRNRQGRLDGRRHRQSTATSLAQATKAGKNTSKSELDSIGRERLLRQARPPQANALQRRALRNVPRPAASRARAPSREARRRGKGRSGASPSATCPQAASRARAGPPRRAPGPRSPQARGRRRGAPPGGGRGGAASSAARRRAARGCCHRWTRGRRRWPSSRGWRS